MDQTPSRSRMDQTPSRSWAWQARACGRPESGSRTSLAEMTIREEVAGRFGIIMLEPEAAPAPRRHPRSKSVPGGSRQEVLAARSTATPTRSSPPSAPSPHSDAPRHGGGDTEVLGWPADVPNFEDPLQSCGSPSTRASSPSAVAPEPTLPSTMGSAGSSAGEMSQVMTKKAKTTCSLPTAIPSHDHQDEAMPGVARSVLPLLRAQFARGLFSTEPPPSTTSSPMSASKILVPVPPRSPNTAQALRGHLRSRRRSLAGCCGTISEVSGARRAVWGAMFKSNHDGVLVASQV